MELRVSCVWEREREWNRLTLCWSWRHLDFRSASSSVSLWTSAARNAAPPYVSPFHTFAPSFTSSVHLSETPEGNPVWKHYRCSLLLLSLLFAFLVLSASAFFLSFPSVCFSLYTISPFQSHPPPSPPLLSTTWGTGRLPKHRLVNCTGLSVGKQACASSCKTETCWQASVTHVIQAADHKLIVQYAGRGRFEQFYCPVSSENGMQDLQHWNAVAYFSGVDTLVKRITEDFFFLLQKCKVWPFHNGIVVGGMQQGGKKGGL